MFNIIVNGVLGSFDKYNVIIFKQKKKYNRHYIFNISVILFPKFGYLAIILLVIPYELWNRNEEN